jgi:hypothetical protein
MWQRFEQRKIHQLNNTERLRLAQLEGQPRDCRSLIRPGLRKHYFPYIEVKSRQFNQFSFSTFVPGQKLH